MWVLVIEPRTSERAAGVLNCRAASQTYLSNLSTSCPREVAQLLLLESIINSPNIHSLLPGLRVFLSPVLSFSPVNVQLILISSVQMLPPEGLPGLLPLFVLSLAFNGGSPCDVCVGSLSGGEHAFLSVGSSAASAGRVLTALLLNKALPEPGQRARDIWMMSGSRTLLLAPHLLLCRWLGNTEGKCEERGGDVGSIQNGPACRPHRVVFTDGLSGWR